MSKTTKYKKPRRTPKAFIKRYFRLIIGGLTGPLPILLFFAGLVLLALLVGKITEGEPLIKGSGIPQVEGQIHGHFHPCWWKVLVKKFIGGALCIVAGLSLGREGPSIQLALWPPRA